MRTPLPFSIRQSMGMASSWILFFLLFCCSVLGAQAQAPLAPTAISYTAGNNSITIHSITPGSPTDGYLISINRVLSFTVRGGVPSGLPTPSTAYSGSGEQLVYFGTSQTPEVTITGLDGYAAGYYIGIQGYNQGITTHLLTSSVYTEAVATNCNTTPPTVTAASISQGVGTLTLASLTSDEVSGYLVKMNTTNSFTPPAAVEASLPSASAAYTGGEQVIYAGTSATPALDITGLSSDATQYFFQVYTYGDCGDGNFYFETTGFNTNQFTCGPPSNGYNLNLFTSGGAIDIYALTPAYSRSATLPSSGTLVYINDQNSFTDPEATLATLPTANSVYSGSGQQLIFQENSGFNSNFAPVSGLTPNTTYYFRSYVFHNCEGTYYVNQADFKELALTTCDFSDNLASAPVFGAITDNTMQLNSFTGLSSAPPATAPDGYIIRINDVNNFSTYAHGTALPTGDPVYSGTGEQVIYVGNSTSPNVSISGLSANTNYFFNIIAHYPACGVPAQIRYQQGGYTFSQSNSGVATPSITFNDIYKSVGDPDFSLSAIASDGSTVSFQILTQTSLGTSLSGANNETVTLGNAGTVLIEASANGATTQATLTITNLAVNGTYFMTENEVFFGENGSTTTQATFNGGTYGTKGTGVDVLDGAVWISSSEGGGNNKGVLVRQNLDGTSPTTWDVPSSASNGGVTVFSAGGKIWTYVNGASGLGEIHVRETDGTNVQFVHSFTGSDLFAPTSELVEFNGVFYGATYAGVGGASGGGIFSLTPDGMGGYTYAVEHSFSSSDNERQPFFGMVQFNNLLWYSSGANRLVAYDPATKTFPHSFALTSFGSNPVNINNELYVFESLDLVKVNSSNSLSTVYRLTNHQNWDRITSDGEYIYGSGRVNGGGGDGVVYRIKPDGTGFEVLYSNPGLPFTGRPTNILSRVTTGVVFVDQTVSHGSTITLESQTNSSGAVTYELIGDVTASSLVGDQFTAGNVGSVTIRVNVAQDANFNAITKDVTYTIVKADPTFIIADINRPFEGASNFALVPQQSNYPGAIVYEFVDGASLVTTGPNTGASIAGNLVTHLNPGTEVIRATLAETANFNGRTIDFQFTVLKVLVPAAQINLNPPASLDYDATPKDYTVSLSGSFNPPLAPTDFEFTYEGRNGTVYASSNTAPTDAGDYTVNASVMASNPTYRGSNATDFTIAPATTTINLNLPMTNPVYTGAGIAISPFANDVQGNPTLTLVTEYSVQGAGVFSTTLPVDAGTYDVRVNLDASETNYTASEATGTFTIDGTPQTITFNPIPDVECGQTTIDLTLYATSSTGSTLTFASDNPAVATVSGGTATIVGTGTANITASQAGNASIEPAVDQTQTLTIAAVQEYYAVDNPADVLVCDGGPYLLPALTEGNYFSEPGGAGIAYSVGDPISVNSTVYIYGVSSVNATCTDENSFTVTIETLAIDQPADITALANYTLPALTNGSYFSAAGGGGTALNAGDVINTTQTIYIYRTDAGTGCTREHSFTVTIIPNPALHFEQVTNLTDYDYLSVPDDNSLDFTNSFTYEAWVNFDQLSVTTAGYGWRSFFQKSRFTDSYGLMLLSSSKLLRFYHNGVGGNSTDYTWSSLTPNTWHHVAVKYDGPNSKTSILINGVEVSSNTAQTGSLVVNTEPLLIGSGDVRTNDPYPFDGAMDEIRFWNVARTDAEILANKDLELQGNESGLVLYYNFSEGTIDGDNTGITQVLDQSSAGNNATFNRFALTGTASNYVDGSGNGVSPGLPQSITFNPLSNVNFGDADFNLTATASSGLAVSYVSSNTAVATVSGNTVTAVGVGSTTITATQNGDASYLPASSVDQVLTVDPFTTSINLNLPGTNPTYTGVGQGISPRANDTGGNPTLNLVTEYSPQGAGTFSTTLPVNAGTYDVRVNLSASETNYTAPQATGTFTIDKAPLTARLDDASLVYGVIGANNHPATYTGFVNGETESVLNITLGSPTAIYLDLINGGYFSVGGPYVGGIIWDSPQGSVTSSNYAITFEPGDITAITPRPVNVTANPKSITYGEDANTGHTVIFEPYDEPGQRGLANGENAANFSGSVLFDNITEVNVGVYAGTIIPNGGLTNANYAINYVAGELTINTKGLTVTADNRTIAYGNDRNAGHTVTYTGFISGEDETALGGTLTFANIISGAVGSYTGVIVPQGLTSTNYAITFVEGDLTIVRKALTVTAVNRTITYGDDANAGNTVSYTGFAPAEDEGDLGGTLSFATISQTDVGSYTGVIVPSGYTSDNYTISYINGDLSIATRAITVTADAKAKSYGDADPAFSYQVTSGALQGSDMITGALTRVAGENVGTYAINQGTLDAGSNYALTYVSNDLTIGALPITITADAKSKTYGDADPVLTYQVTTGALQGSDVLTGDLRRVAGEGVGTYAIQQGTVDNSNYAITYVSDNLTISSRAITVTADPASKVYGDSDPAFTYQLTSGSLVGSDAFVGILERAAGENVGTYALTQGTLGINANYNITFVPADLTISARPITITADAQVKAFGDVDPTFTYQVTNGVLQGSDVLTGALTRTPGEDVGTYALQQGTVANNNYVIAFVSDDLTISKADQVITFSALTNKSFGDPAFDLTATGGASGNVVTYVSSNTAVATVSGATVTIVGVGTSTITASQLGNANYNDAMPVDQLLTVEQGTFDRYFVKVHSIYGITDGGQTSLVRTLSTSEGQNIEALAKVGNQIWGTTSQGGANSMGTLFRMDPNGANFEKLHDFTVAEASPRNDLAVVADTAVYGVVGDYGIFRASVTNPAADLVFYNGYSGGNQFTTGLTYHRGKLWTSDNGSTNVGVDIDFTANETMLIYTSGGGLLTGGLPATDIIAEGFWMTQNYNFSNSAYFPYAAPTYSDREGWVWGQTNGNLPNFLPVPLEDINQTKIIFADGQFFNSYSDLVSFGLQMTQAETYNSSLAFTNSARALVPALNSDIGATSLSSLSKPYVNIYDAQDSVLWGIRGDAASGLHEAFSYDIRTTQYEVHDFGPDNLAAGVPNAGFFNFRKTATLVTHDQTMSYNSAVPALTYEIWGLDAGDDATDIGGVMISSEAIFGAQGQPEVLVTSTSHPGIYPIKAVADTANGKYDLRHLFGSLTITYAIQPSDIDFSPSDVSFEYDGTAKAFTAAGKAGTPAAASGLFADESGQLLATTDFDYTYLASTDGGTTYIVDLGTTAPTAVGLYRATATVKSTNTVYSGSATFDFEITPRALTVTADAQSKAYGDVDPALTYQITSGVLQGSDMLSGDLARVAGEGVGTYAINQGTLDAGSNYALTYVSNNLTIGTRAITVTADPASKVYGDADPAFTYQLTSGSLAVSDVFVGILERTAGESVGTYALNQGTLGINANYAITFVPADLTIGVRALTVTADAQSKTYGDADPALTYQLTTGALQGSDAFTGALTRVTGENAGTYAINQGTLDAGSNYSLTYVSDNLTIGTRALTVTADATSKTYGDTDPVLTYQITSGALQGSDAITGALTRLAGENVGTYAINQGTLDAGSNYTLSYISDNLTITQRALSVIPINRNKTYGDADPTLDYSLFPGSQLVGSDSFTGSLVRTVGENVGTYDVTLGTLSAGPNYLVSLQNTGTFEITARPLSVTADDQTKIIGEVDPALTYTITSGTLAGSDMLSGALTRVTGETIGNYAIQQGTLDAGSNYTLSFTDGTLTITDKIPQTITFGALGAVQYGNADFNLSATGGASGNLVTFTSSDLSVATISGNTVTIVGAGTTTITASQVGDATYADAADVIQSLVVNPRPIFLSANTGQGKVYGSTDPALTYQVVAPLPLLSGDVLTGSPERVAGENVGTYSITQGTLGNPNYNIVSFNPANFEITQRDVTVAVEGSQTKVYGQPDPVFTYQTIPALESGDVFTGALSRAAGENVGTYAIQQGSLDNSNYNITFMGDNFSVTTRAVTVTVDAGQTKVYGQADPANYTFTSAPALVTGDVFTGALTRVAGETVGAYAIEQGTLDAGSNYALTYVSDDFSINQKSLTVTVDAGQRKTYGDADPTFTFSLSGTLESGDSFTGAFERVAGENVGTYVINQGTFTAGSNYFISYIGSSFTIDPIALTIAADDQTKVIGAPDPALTYTITSGALQFSDAVTGTLTRDAGETVGTYAITQGTAALSANYNLTFVPGTLTITDKIPQTITFGALSAVTYGDANFDLTATGGASGNAVTYVSSDVSVATVSGSTVTIVGAGTATITASQAGDATYADAADVNQVLTVNTLPITVTSDAGQTKIYGDADPTFTYAITSGTLVGMDALSGTLDRVIGDNVGTYAIGQGTLANANYDITFVSNDFEITTRAITVTAEASQAKIYADPDPVFTYQITSGALQGSDLLNGALTRVAGENVGTYAITQGTLDNTNYDITFVGDDFVINQLGIIITSEIKTKVYGDPDPAFTVGFISGSLQGSDVFTGALVREVGEDVGTYVINQGTLDNPNYNISFLAENLSITARPITVTADAKSKTYGDTDPTLTYQLTSGVLQGSDMLSGDLTRVTGENAGTYAINQGTVSAGSNYALTYVNADLTIDPIALAITADDKTKVQGTSNPAFTYRITSGALINGDMLSGVLTVPASAIAVGMYPIQKGTLTAGGNYTISYTDGTFTITDKLLQNITFNALTAVTYGDAVFNLSATGGASGNAVTFTGDNTAVATVTSAGEVTIVGAGTVNITANQAGDATYADADPVIRSLTVNKAMLFATPDDKTSTYGDTALPTFTVSYSGFVNGEDESVLTTPVDLSSSAMVGSNAMSYPITASGGAADNYQIVPLIGALAIEPAALTITADDKTTTYGDGIPSLTLSYAGFVNSEDETVLTTAPTVSTSATSTSSAGTYAITVSGAAADNYTITEVNGTLNIGKATLSVTADDQSKTYGAANPSLTLSYAGFIGSDDESVLDTAPAASTTADATSAVGTYAITAGGGVDNNYTFSYKDGTLTVNQAMLSVTADDQSKTYGEANPTLTLTYSGFQNGEDETSLTSVPSATTSATSTSSLGTYAITASGGAADNYAFTYTDGTLTVNQATLSVTADDQSRTYGDANPGLTLTYLGFQNEDDETSLATAPTAATTANETSSVGTYTITASGGVADNYAFSYTEGTLTVNQATLSVIADDQTITYGEAIPSLTFNYTGFIGSDDETVLDTAPTASTNATTTSDAGAYSITVSGGSDNNYAFDYTDGKLTINKADQVITFGALTDKTVGDADFELTATASSGLKVTYTSSDETVATIAGSTVTILTAGTTTITASQDGDTNFNTATAVEQTLTVNTNIQDQTITFETLDNQSYGASPFELAAVASSGLAVSYTSSDETVATIAGSTVTIHAVGIITITASQAGNDRFTAAASVKQTLTVDPATLTVQADDKSKVYGEANPTLTLTYVGFVNGEDATVLDTTPTVATTVDASSEVGAYEIAVAGGSASNYVITPVAGTMTITKATLVATADDQVMRTGESVPTLTISYVGFVNGDTEADIDIAPAISTDATSASASGLYDILLTGGEDNNYDLTLINGTLTIETVLGLVLEQSQIMIYPNPVMDKLYIDFPQSLSGEVIQVQLFDLEGRKLQSKEVKGYGVELDVRELPSGLLILQMSANGEVIRKRVKKD